MSNIIPTIQSDSFISQLRGPQQDYYPETIVQEIEKMKTLGKKICLFACRTEDQALPVIENEVWISGDIAVNGIIPPSRLHIWANFDKEEQLKKFHGLFDKIVIDQSSVKLLQSGFVSRFVKLLKPSKDAELIFENCFGQSFTEAVENPVIDKDSIVIPTRLRMEAFEIADEWVKKTFPQGTPQYEENFNTYYSSIKVLATRCNWNEDRLRGAFISWLKQTKFPKDLDPMTGWIKEASQKRIKYLEEYFDSVTLHEDDFYPYETKVSNIKSDFLVAKGYIPK